MKVYFLCDATSPFFRRNTLYVFIALLTLLATSSGWAHTAPSLQNQPDTDEVSENATICFSELQQLLGSEQAGLSDDNEPVTAEKLNLLISAIEDQIQNISACTTFMQEYESLLVQEEEYFDKEELLKYIPHLSPSPSTQMDWLEWGQGIAYNSAHSVMSQYWQNSPGISILSSIASKLRSNINYYYKSYRAKQKPKKAPYSGYFTNCFLKKNLDVCFYSSWVVHSLTLMASATVAYTSYRLMDYGGGYIPSNAFMVMAVVANSLSFSWWPDLFSFGFIGSLTAQTYFMLADKHRLMINSKKMLQMYSASFFLNDAILVFLRSLYTGFWHSALLDSPIQLTITSFIALRSLISYVRNIDSREAIFLPIADGKTTSYTIMAAAALFYHIQTPFMHWHLAYMYGGLIFNSLVTSSNLNTVIPVLTHSLMFTFHFANNLRVHAVDVIEEFDKISYFIYNIILPPAIIFGLLDRR